MEFLLFIIILFSIIISVFLGLLLTKTRRFDARRFDSHTLSFENKKHSESNIDDIQEKLMKFLR